MELKTHDLVWINSCCALKALTKPDWVGTALAQFPVVVVRRAKAPTGWISVGIRGKERHQRHAALLPESEVLSYRTPESLVVERVWDEASRLIRPSALQTLRALVNLADSEGISWGLVGSVGYELATGTRATHEDSDVDIIINLMPSADLQSLRRFYEKLSMLSCRVDALMETPHGAVSLEEFMGCPERLLVRTDSGAHLGAIAYQ
jgi:phosphoribosyl-dephospho-CoA transferase